MKRTVLLFFQFFFLAVSCKRDEPITITQSIQYGLVAKVISFNIRHTGEETADGVNRWENRRDAVIEMINAEMPSFLGLQEAMPAQIDYLQGALSQYSYVGIAREGNNTPSEANPIFYLKDRYSVIDWGTFWLSKTPDVVSIGWDSTCPRIVTWAHFQENGTGAILYYLNTHLDWESALSRKESVKVIANFINETIPSQSPVIVGGDMNTTNMSVFGPLYSCGFINARECALMSDNKTTYHGWGRVTDMMIDHFFVKNLSIEAFNTMDEMNGEVFISDHNPIAMMVCF